MNLRTIAWIAPALVFAAAQGCGGEEFTSAASGTGGTPPDASVDSSSHGGSHSGGSGGSSGGSSGAGGMGGTHTGGSHADGGPGGSSGAGGGPGDGGVDAIVKSYCSGSGFRLDPPQPTAAQPFTISFSGDVTDPVCQKGRIYAGSVEETQPVGCVEHSCTASWVFPAGSFSAGTTVGAKILTHFLDTSDGCCDAATDYDCAASSSDDIAVTAGGTEVAHCEFVVD